jgi:hypothetical protein
MANIQGPSLKIFSLKIAHISKNEVSTAPKESRMTLALLDGAGRFADVTSLVAKISPSFLPNGTL